MIRNKYFLLAFRLIVGGAFFAAGLLKVGDPLEFAQNIKNFRIVSHQVSFLAALILPWIEILCGALLITGILRRPSALLASGLLVGFIILVGVTMARGIDTDCGCFGSLSHKADWWLLLQDGVLLLMSLCVLFPKPDPHV
jgi:putative oxidoreductase